LIALLMMVSPLDYTQDAYNVPVHFVTGNLVERKLCDGPLAMACVRFEKDRNVMVLPNPCDPQLSGQGYALLVCHELRHVNGWRHPKDRNQ
jgi:hypothetical protein